MIRLRVYRKQNKKEDAANFSLEFNLILLDFEMEHQSATTECTVENKTARVRREKGNGVWAETGINREERKARRAARERKVKLLLKTLLFTPLLLL